MKIYQYREWIEKAEQLFGKDPKDWKFKCCSCGHVQTMLDFEEAKIDQPETKVYFSCIGRWIGAAGNIENNKSPCNYTLGGLLKFNDVQIIDIEGKARPVFDFAE